MADGAIFDPQTARWLVNLNKKLEGSQLLNPGQIERIVLKVMPRFQGGGSSIKYFVLAEDAAALPVYFWPGIFDEATGTIDPDPAVEEPLELYYWLSVLSSPKQAKAGYAGIYASVGNKKVFVNGPCIDSCQTSSSISPGTPPDGEVDVAYTHTVTVSGLDVDGVSADGLPPGLTIDAETGEITGTPTTAGTYWVTLMGDSDDTPACPLTRIVKIVIAESTGPDPEPEVP